VETEIRLCPHHDSYVSENPLAHIEYLTGRGNEPKPK
jgi:hypothetical protein